MILNVLDKKIRQAFSDAAFQYEALTSLHNEIGRELVKKLTPIEQNEVILDLGMGTGRFTKKLGFYFPESKIVGMDFADGMIAQAKAKDGSFSIVQADAKGLPIKKGSVDILTSNLAFQWFGNLESVFAKCHDVLRPNGILSITLFGYHTLNELFTSLEQTSENEQIFPVQRLARFEEIKAAIEKCNFTDIKINYERIKVRFQDLFELIKWTKEIGANALYKEAYIGKEWLQRANEYYLANFKDRFGALATLEVIWLDAKR